MFILASRDVIEISNDEDEYDPWGHKDGNSYL